MKKIFYIFIAAILCACNQTSTPTATNAKGNVEKMTYTEDERVGLCYGVLNSTTSDGFEVTVPTCVPCDSVRHLIKK